MRAFFNKIGITLSLLWITACGTPASSDNFNMGDQLISFATPTPTGATPTPTPTPLPKYILQGEIDDAYSGNSGFGGWVQIQINKNDAQSPIHTIWGTGQDGDHFEFELEAGTVYDLKIVSYSVFDRICFFRSEISNQLSGTLMGHVNLGSAIYCRRDN